MVEAVERLLFCLKDILFKELKEITGEAYLNL